MRVAVVMMGLVLMACASAENDKKQPTPAKELAAGGAQIRGGGIRMDVQIGRAQPKRPVKNAKVTATPNATVAP